MSVAINKQPSGNRNVVMIGCFDTKAEDFEYLYNCLLQNKLGVTTINTGVLGTTTRFPVNIEAETVALEAGSELSVIRKNKDRGSALKIMAKGAKNVITHLMSQGKIDAIISMGGGGGTFIALNAMQALPFGIPKLCLSTLATKDLSKSIGSKDILLMPSIVDVAGLNTISRVLIAQAAAAICGMMKVQISKDYKSKGSIAMSVFGNTTICADSCTELLKAQHYDVLSFHAVGTGGMTMESLINDAVFDAVLDLTTTELADELCGGICSAGPDRLSAASQMGIPQIVIPGCLDMVNFGALDTVPEKYKNRQLFSWAPDVTLMRTNADENRTLGEIIAKKINDSEGKVIVVLPLGGLSKIGGKGEIFHNPEIDKVLFDAIKSNSNSAISIVEVQANINTPAFAKKAVEALLSLIEK